MPENPSPLEQKRGLQGEQEVLLVGVETPDEMELHRIQVWRDRDETALGAPVFLSADELAVLVETGQLELTVEQAPRIDAATFRR